MATQLRPAAALPVTIDDIVHARTAIDGAVLRTPTQHSRTLSAITGANLWLKFENLQFTASFKERGALNRLSKLTPEEHTRGVVAASAGNHAQGVAYHARRLGIPATIVMPRFTPTVKVRQTEEFGATVLLVGDTLEESFVHARDLEAKGAVFIHAYDDPDVIAGQGTIALEMLEDAPEIDVLLTPIGGGGLMSGMGLAARAIKPGIELIGVETELYPGMWNRFHRHNAPCGGDTLAEGIAVKEPGGITAEILTAILDEVVLVPERDIERAVALLLNVEKTVVEGAGAAGLAAVLGDPPRFRGRNIGLVLCGGNIDSRLLATVLMRELAREGRLARIRIAMRDRPGQLHAVTRVFDACQANIIEVHHQRVFSREPAKGITTDIECETRDRDHLQRLIAALETAGFAVKLLGVD